jgi:hypothetical protein
MARAPTLLLAYLVAMAIVGASLFRRQDVVGVTASRLMTPLLGSPNACFCPTATRAVCVQIPLLGTPSG